MLPAGRVRRRVAGHRRRRRQPANCSTSWSGQTSQSELPLTNFVYPARQGCRAPRGLRAVRRAGREPAHRAARPTSPPTGTNGSRRGPGRSSADASVDASRWARLAHGRLAGAVPALFLVVFFVWPVLAIVARGFDLAAIADVLGDPRQRSMVWFTFWQAAVCTALTVAIGLVPAYVLARFRFAGRRAVLASSPCRSCSRPSPSVPRSSPCCPTDASHGGRDHHRPRLDQPRRRRAHGRRVAQPASTHSSRMPRRRSGPRPWQAMRHRHAATAAARRSSPLQPSCSCSASRRSGSCACSADRPPDAGGRDLAAHCAAPRPPDGICPRARPARVRRRAELVVGPCASGAMRWRCGTTGDAARTARTRAMRVGVAAVAIGTAVAAIAPLSLLVIRSLEPTPGRWGFGSVDRDRRRSPRRHCGPSVRFAVAATADRRRHRRARSLGDRGRWPQRPAARRRPDAAAGHLRRDDRLRVAHHVRHAAARPPRVDVHDPARPRARCRPVRGPRHAAGPPGDRPGSARGRRNARRGAPTGPASRSTCRSRRRALASGAGFAAAISLGEFGATSFLTRTGRVTAPIADRAAARSRSSTFNLAQAFALATALTALTASSCSPSTICAIGARRGDDARACGDVTVRFGSTTVLDQVSLSRRPRRGRRAAGPERLGQEHPAAGDRRAHEPDGGSVSLRRRAARRRRRPPSPVRLRLPGRATVPAPRRGGQRGVRPADDGHVEGAPRRGG